ncbi:acyltransferase family protein [Methylobacterium aquaticum]|uniref:acyltransferase family protein n=1 Tax=Methylobacterium aquaticum TaxID=270351 RepID=UPI003D180CA5
MSPIVPAVAQGGGRAVTLDRLRGALVGLVVLHHAILAYCTFGHVDRADSALSTAPIVDPERWRAFDALVLLDDAFFMPLLFLLSGLFVWDGLARKGPGAFLRDRMRRLGLPFAVAVLTLVPLAYYPSFLQAGGRAGFAAFWIRTVTVGPWPSGPPWFLGVLLAFDAVAALVFVRMAGRPPAGGANPHPLSLPTALSTPASGFVVLVAVSGLLYIPLLLAVGPARWVGFGPFAIQASRVGLYATYFAAGAVLGRGGMPAIRRCGQALVPHWRLWSVLAVPAGLMLLAAGAIGAAGRWPAGDALALEGVARTVFCATAALALPALFLRFGGRPSRAWDSLSANSFAIYLLHYPAVTWTQFGLLALPLGAALKGAIVFAVAFAASWAGAVAVRRVPFVRKRL